MDMSRGVWEAGTTSSGPGTRLSHEASGGREGRVGEGPDRMEREIPVCVWGGKAPGEEGGQTCAGCWGGPAEEALAETTHFLTFHSNVIRMGI